jgi:hypothetical protein
MAMIDMTRCANPIRFRKARSDAHIGSLQTEIESVFGLPVGCIRIEAPDGRRMRRDATIARLRKLREE